MSNIVYIATSLDGYIATKDGGIDWLHDIPNPDQSDFGFAEFMNSIDALIMGRNTFEKVLTFGQWPYAKKVFVLSNTLTQVPEHLTNKVEIVSGPLGGVMETLQNRGLQNFYIDGGRVIQSFLKESLIDELIVTTIPILLGDGIPLFGTMEQQTKLTHVKTTIYNDSLVKSHYKINRAD